MGGMVFIVIGLFFLVWIISQLVKASQDPGNKRPNNNGPQRQRRVEEPRVERTSSSDIDRFMAEIDRLRRKGEGAPAGNREKGAPPESQRGGARGDRSTARPAVERREREREQREREREQREREQRDRRPKSTSRGALAAPPPIPPSVDPVPVLKPLPAEAVQPTAAPGPVPTPMKQARLAKAAPTAAASAGARAAPSPVLLSLQAILKDKNGPAAALILAEVLGKPKGAMARGKE